MTEGEITVLHTADRIVRHVSDHELRALAREAGWQEKSIYLLLRQDIVNGKLISHTAPVPCGKWALVRM